MLVSNIDYIYIYIYIYIDYMIIVDDMRLVIKKIRKTIRGIWERLK
jgi:hypothetical protein